MQNAPQQSKSAIANLGGAYVASHTQGHHVQQAMAVSRQRWRGGEGCILKAEVVEMGPAHEPADVLCMVAGEGQGQAPNSVPGMTSFC